MAARQLSGGWKMDYKIIYFRNDQFLDCQSFLGEFKKKTYQATDFMGDPWWTPTNPFRGFLFFAYIEGEEIVSRCAITERKLKFAGAIIDSYEIGGNDTLPQHRKRGLLTSLIRGAMEVGFAAGPKLIYGTPNARSGPAYRKLQYSFVDSEDQYLVLMITSVNPVLRKLALKKDDIISTRRGQNYKNLLRRLTITEISVSEYIDATKGFLRMNYTDHDYLTRRLRVIEVNNRRFFRWIGDTGEFYCVIRNHKLGFLQPLLVSEYFLNGCLDHSAGKFGLLRAIEAGYYHNTDGIYLRCNVDPRSILFRRFAKYGYVVHRKLPICYAFADIKREDVDQMMSQLVTIYQLSDCDIG
jgi:hypothetical protein